MWKQHELWDGTYTLDDLLDAAELEHDAAVCLKLTLEEAVWTLEGFFGGGGSASRTENPDT